MTEYFCWKCKTKDHWANEPCTACTKTGEIVVAPVVQEPEQITKAKEFVRDVNKRMGRPKIYPDRKTQMREYMRRYREKRSKRVVG